MVYATSSVSRCFALLILLETAIFVAGQETQISCVDCCSSSFENQNEVDNCKLGCFFPEQTCDELIKAFDNGKGCDHGHGWRNGEVVNSLQCVDGSVFLVQQGETTPTDDEGKSSSIASKLKDLSTETIIAAGLGGMVVLVSFAVILRKNSKSRLPIKDRDAEIEAACLDLDVDIEENPSRDKSSRFEWLVKSQPLFLEFSEDESEPAQELEETEPIEEAEPDVVEK